MMREPDMVRRLAAGARTVAVVLIRAYRGTISAVLPPSCRFEPSCSRYMEEAILRYGLVRGLAKGARRVLHCHPFHPGGFDPVEERAMSDPGRRR